MVIRVVALVRFVWSLILFGFILCNHTDIGSDKMLGLRCIQPSERLRRRKVAIGFYGMSRSLTYTLPSIEKHVFQVLGRGDIPFDVFTDTLSLNDFENARSHEKGYLDKFEASLLRPCYASITSQELLREQLFDIFATARNMSATDKAQAHGHKHDVAKDGFASVKNILCALHSLESLLKLIQTVSRNHRQQYSAVMILRPDTVQLIDTDIITHLENGDLDDPQTLFIPDFQHWHGVNDRMAYGSPTAMSVYMRRGSPYMHSTETHTDEVLLEHHLNKNNITRKYTNMRCVRVRLQGKAVGIDSKKWNFNLPANYTGFHQCVNKNTGEIIKDQC